MKLTQICNHCKIEKEYNKFGINNNVKTKINSRCKECINALKRQKHIPKIKNTKCSICDNKVKARSYCNKHLFRFYKHGDPNVLLHKTTCKIENCNRKHHSKGFCSRHFEQERRKNGYHATTARKIPTRFTDNKRYAKKRGLNWDITLEEYTKLIDNTCFYCSGPLPETKVGLDRKDSEKGYTLDNVVPCCRYCNQLKSNIFTFDEFLIFSKTDLFKTVLNRLHHLISKYNVNTRNSCNNTEQT